MRNNQLVEYIKHWGSDLDVVNAARVSFGRRKNEMDEKDSKLINYLAKHSHHAPFRHVGATFCITCPIAVARQIHKHQIGITISEISGRYIVASRGDYWLPDVWRKGADNVKQGSSLEPVCDQDVAEIIYKMSMEDSYKSYESLLANGVCREQARMVLPQGMLTQFWMSGSLQAWAHFYSLRAEASAQREVQVYAREIGKDINELFPDSWAALTAE